MVKRKIPARKHRGVKDPTKQAALRIASIKDKVNNPPTQIDDQAVPRRALELQRSIELLKNRQPKKKNKHKRGEKLIDTTNFKKKEVKLPGMTRKEKPVPVFKQLPGEKPKSFLHRIQLKCQEMIHESKFEDKFNVEVKRDEVTGAIQKVEKLSMADTKFLKDLTTQTKPNKKTTKSAEKKKQRLEKFKEKKHAKKERKVDEFAHYKDVVQFGEIVHEPPKLLTLPRKAGLVDMPGKRDLLLKGLLPSNETPQKMESVFNRKMNSDTGKIHKKKKNDKSPAQKRIQEAQRVAAVQAYRDMKARKQANNKN